MLENAQHGYYGCKNLDQGEWIIAEYLWIDGTDLALRSKQRTLKGKINSVKDLPDWNYDGSSTYQAETDNSEVILKPAAFFRDPFRGGDNVLVICEAYKWTDTNFKELVPANTNFRHFAKKIMDQGAAEEPWFGIEQEYTLLAVNSNFQKWPLGWPSNGFPGPQGPYYCSVGASRCFGRVIMDAHYKACLYAGVLISGSNGEVMPGQWEFQVGPCVGIDIGDHLWMARYLVGRCAEDFNVDVSFEPKLFKDWNGAGCHTNYSTKSMRAKETGMQTVEDYCKRLAEKHATHIEVYGEGNDQRLTGIHETSSISSFSYGIGNRAASVRIPTSTAEAKCGYIEDRRPASNIDPYIVGAILVATTVNQGGHEAMIEHYKKWVEWKKTDPFPQ